MIPVLIAIAACSFALAGVFGWALCRASAQRDRAEAALDVTRAVADARDRAATLRRQQAVEYRLAEDAMAPLSPMPERSLAK